MSLGHNGKGDNSAFFSFVSITCRGMPSQIIEKYMGLCACEEQSEA